jgi:hypothetical protein
MAEVAYAIIKKLGSVAYEELHLEWGVKSDLRKLQDTMSTIRAVLLDAEKKQASNALLRIWTEELNNVLHDAEDVIDEIEYEALREQVVATYGSLLTKVLHFCSSFMTRAFPFKLAHRIKGVNERLDATNAKKDQFNLTIIHGESHIMHRMRDPTHSFVDPSTVIGRGEDVDNILSLMFQSDGSKNVHVISIYSWIRRFGEDHTCQVGVQ